MPALVCDTHAAVWYLHDDPRISPKAGDVMDSVIRAGERIYVPSISLVELTYLVEKGRMPRVALERLRGVLTDASFGFRVAALILR